MAAGRIAVLGLLLAIGCSGLSEEELADIMRRAQACEDGDTCVISPRSDCRCRIAINAGHVEEVAEALAEYDCQGLHWTCRIPANPRCEEGTCVADDVGCCE